MGNYAPWVPLTLIGIELSVRRKRLVERAGALGLAGLGLSQMLGGWVGQGTYYAVLLVASYVVLSVVISPPGPANGVWQGADDQSRRSPARRLALAGFGLAAAGILPRLDVSRVTNLAGGRYDLIAGATAIRVPAAVSSSARCLIPSQNARRIYLGTGNRCFGDARAVVWRGGDSPFPIFRLHCACFALMLRTRCRASRALSAATI